MKISGFTIIKNAVINDFPAVESIKSILPVVDEMIVLIGDGTDDTEALIRSIDSPKIKIHHSVWNASLRKGGEVLADETNKALALIDPASDWAFYIQADEVVHEKDHAAIRQACEQYLAHQQVKCLVFSYVHFYGTYDYIGDSRKWYDKEIRIIRNDKNIRSYKDAQGFRTADGEKLPGKLIAASIYHYGWVKSPAQMRKKHLEASKYWNTDEEIKELVFDGSVFDFTEFDSLGRFTNNHPAVMANRIKAQNWHLDLDISKKRLSFKAKALQWIEKRLGRRLFYFRNFRLV